MLMANPQKKPGRMRRYAKRAAIGVGALLGLVVLLVFGLLFSLRFARVRNFVVARVNGALTDSFQGRIHVSDLGSVGLGGISAGDAQIFDPAGRRVIDIHGLEVHLSVPTLAWAAIAHSSEPLTLHFNDISVKHVEVLLVDNGKGSPTLVDAFTSKTPSPASSGPGTTVVIDRLELGHVWAHGALASTPPLDVELKDALGSLRTDDVATLVAFQRAGVKARGLPAGVDPVGEFKASLNIPAAPSKPMAARAHYEGTAATVPLTLDANFVDNNLHATVEAKRIPPEVVNARVPGLALRSPASLSASADGKLPDVHGQFALGVGAGNVEGDFALSLQKDLTAKTTIRTHDLDIAELAPNAPASSLDLTLTANALVPQAGPITGKFALDTAPSVVLAESVPAIAATGTFLSDVKNKRNRVDTHAEIAEPGAHTSVDATVTQGSVTAVEFKTASKLDNPPRLRKLAEVSSVQGELTSQGNYQVEENRLNADVHADLRGVRQGSNRVEHANLRATVAGVLPHPNADVRVDLTNAELSGQHVANAQVAARGSLSHLALSAEVATLAPARHMQLSAIVSNDHGILLDHPSLNLKQDATNLRISAATVKVVDGVTRVSALHVEGAGRADASLVYGPTLQSANVQTYDLDLARVWRLFDPHAPLKSGTATLSVDYDRNGGNPRARISAHSQDLTFDRVKGGVLSADVALEDQKLEGHANADLKQLGKLNFDFENLRGINPDHFDAGRVTGKLAVSGQVRLRDLNELVPKDSNSPIERALGTVEYDIAIEREHPGPGLPTLHAHVTTKGLQLAGVRDSKTTITTLEEAREAAPLSVKGLDVDIDVTHAESGETALVATLRDEHGTLSALSVQGKATPRLATVASELASQWRQLPLSLKLTVPPRELQQLPVEIRPQALSGLLSAELDYDGTLSAPRLKFVGKVDRFRQDQTSTKSLDVAWQASYDGNHGKLDGSARSGSKDVAKANIDIETALNDWLNRTGTATPAVNASAHVDFDTFPVSLLPGTAQSQVEGSLSGKIALDHFGKDAALDATLDVGALKVSSTPFGNFHTELKANGEKADAMLRIVGEHGASTTAEAHSGLAWGARFVPEVKLPADAQLRAKDLRIGAFSPFVASTFGELDGRVNGEVNAHFRGGDPQLDGHMELQDGVAQLAAVGQRFDQITARVSMEPGKAKLEELTARATSGKLKVTGEARLSGLSLTGADAHLRIAKSEKVALAVAGNEVGDMYGAIDMVLEPNAETHANHLAVNISSLNVRLPDTGGQDVQDLDPAPGVRVGTNQRRGGFVTLPLQPLKDSDPSKNEAPMVVDLNLGSQLMIERGDTTKVQLGGKLHMVLGEPMTMTGIIDLRGGKLDVSGKQFEVESGTVTFAGDPADPSIVATAVWDSGDPDKHRVYATFSGSATRGKLDLRSEPPLTQDQILSLLLTGSADGSLGGGSGGSNTATAVGAVGGAATQGLNKALSGISDLDVSTRIDTSSGSARPELVFQLSPRVAAQITRALGDPAPGQPPDLTFLTFDFRILSHWSLDALIGDRGESGLDLIWRKRY